MLPRPANPASSLLASALAAALVPASGTAQAVPTWSQVEIVRTEFGVPHIRAASLWAAGYGLGWCQAEDWGEELFRRLVRGRGGMGLAFGRDSLESDFGARRAYARAVETYALLDPDVREVMEGFAEGVNRYLELHRHALPAWVPDSFTPYDLAARDIGSASSASARRVLRALGISDPTPSPGDGVGRDAPSQPEDGSNAWALTPDRTASGRAILLRNPHLSWTAGYYEAHLRVPGVLDFYGDFRVGGPFGIIGGFNEHLGWATTNNAPDLDEVYVVRLDPARPDRYLFDGASLPLRREDVTVEYLPSGAGTAAGSGDPGRETRTFWHTHLGPVIHRDGGHVYVQRSAGDGEYRSPEQFLRMMRARSLEEWRDAVRMRARSTSNLTYADRDGNAYYVWNASLPALPHPPGGDSVVFTASRTAHVWTRLVPFGSLPQLLNPPGGYVQNANDPPDFTNLNAVLDRDALPPNLPPARLRLRSQHSLALVHGEGKLSLEDVVELKHSPRMLLADRLKSDLVAAVRASRPDPETRAAADLLETWDGTAAPGSRGAVLFETWYRLYASDVDTSRVFRAPWSPEEPVTTPRGLGRPAAAARAFDRALHEVRRRWGSWDVAWGEVHRVRRGAVDVPVGGCPGDLGCFRVLNFQEDEDGLRVADGGDGWVLAVEFSDPPRAFSVLAYGQSPDPASPHHADQARMFAEGRLKPVAFTDADIDVRAIRRYRPGRPVGDGGR